jgi:lipopolysaccharide assembly protein A
MQALVWILRFLIVVILVWFAVKNSQEVVLNGFPDQQLKAPLVFVLLVVFVAGVVIGLLAWIPTVVRQRREIGRLKRAASQQAVVSSIVSPSPEREREPPGSDIHGI